MVDFFNNFDINIIPKETREALYTSYEKEYIALLETYDDNDDVEEILKEMLKN